MASWGSVEERVSGKAELCRNWTAGPGTPNSPNDPSKNKQLLSDVVGTFICSPAPAYLLDSLNSLLYDVYVCGQPVGSLWAACGQPGGGQKSSDPSQGSSQFSSRRVGLGPSSSSTSPWCCTSPCTAAGEREQSSPPNPVPPPPRAPGMPEVHLSHAPTPASTTKKGNLKRRPPPRTLTGGQVHHRCCNP